MKKILILTLLTVASFLVSSCDQEKVNQVEKKIHAMKVTPKILTSTLYFSGSISPLKVAAVVSPVDAVIKEKNFSFGQAVKAGQALVLLNSSALKKEYDTVLTEFLKSKDNLAIAQSKFVGTKALWSDGLVSKNSFVSDKSALNNTKIAFFQARAKLDELLRRVGNSDVADLSSLSLSEIEKVKLALKKKLNVVSLRAKTSGIALKPPKSSDSSPELQVGSSVKANQVITLIGDLSGLSLKIKISEIDIQKIKPGMKARVKGLAFPKLPLKGVVRRVNAQASGGAGDSGGLPLFFADIVVEKLSKEERQVIKIGMSAAVEVDISSKDLLLVNVDAVYQKAGKTYVDIKDSHGKTTPREITTGQTSADEVVVLTGLKGGETIVWSQ